MQLNNKSIKAASLNNLNLYWLKLFFMGGGGRDQCNLFKQAYLQWFWLWGYKVAINDIIYINNFFLCYDVQKSNL